MVFQKLFIGGVEAGSEKIAFWTFRWGHWCRCTIASAVLVLSKKCLELMKKSNQLRVVEVGICSVCIWVVGVGRWNGEVDEVYGGCCLGQLVGWKW